MNVERIKDCLELLEKYKVPQNVVEHSLKVHEVAMYLVEKFKNAGIHVNWRFVSDAALLHDIDKHKTLDDMDRHGLESERILLSEGFPKEVATCARKHHLGEILKEKPFDSWEEKIVYYADKRVVHDKVVSLDERFAYLRKRYGHINENALKTIDECEVKVKELENEIFSEIKADKNLKGLKD